MSELASRVASPPYDVLNRQEARKMAADNPLSFLRVVKAELEFPDKIDQYSPEVYQRAKENLTRLQAEQVMVRDSHPAFYVYRLTMGGHIQTGLACLVSVAEYFADRIKKHEHTRPEKVSDRADLIEHLQAQVGPVFVAYRWDGTIDGIFQEITAAPATTGFESDDGVRHELWVVDREATIETLVAAFGRLDSLYIADGHHRSQAAAEVCRRLTERQSCGSSDESHDYFLSVLFADRELKILPYNRVVKDLNGLSPEQFIANAGRVFEVSPQAGFVTPERPHCFGVYCDGRWYRLSARPGSFDNSHPTKSIDAAILADNLIAPTLGITDPRTDDRIDFVGGIRGVEELVRLVDSGEYKIAFSLYPTSIDQLLQVADAGEVMPPKSTWFEPKLRSGMVVNLLTE
jgi:uncharacterized protein (DUF1015 family)